ncbi:hypothetical protein HVW88_17180 [Escherichia coli]|nr:hypothetical protein [Escherichia coli]
MSSILEIFFPLCAADPIHWQRRTPDVEHGIWSDVANEQLILDKHIAVSCYDSNRLPV